MASKPRIAVKADTRDHARPIDVLVGDGMYLGIGSPGGGWPMRMIMVRRMGMCRYVCWGKDRGRTLMGVFGFIRIRMLTESEMKRVEKAMNLYKIYES